MGNHRIMRMTLALQLLPLLGLRQLLLLPPLVPSKCRFSGLQSPQTPKQMQPKPSLPQTQQMLRSCHRIQSNCGFYGELRAQLGCGKRREASWKLQRPNCSLSAEAEAEAPAAQATAAATAAAGHCGMHGDFKCSSRPCPVRFRTQR